MFEKAPNQCKRVALVWLPAISSESGFSFQAAISSDSGAPKNHEYAFFNSTLKPLSVFVNALPPSESGFAHLLLEGIITTFAPSVHLCVPQWVEIDQSTAHLESLTVHRLAALRYGAVTREALFVRVEAEVSMQSSAILLISLYTLSLAIAAQTSPTSSPPATTSTSDSSAAKVGLFVNPKNNQSPQQQAEDENACYATAQQQTGIDPSVPPAPPPEAAQKQGGGAKGAAGGAAGGAAVGAIAGDAGTGAAIGATAGAVRGRRQQKKANKQAEQQATQQGQAQQQQKLDTFRRAFSSCIDAKGYSVK